MALPKNLEVRANEALTELIDRKVIERGFESRNHYLRHLEEEGVVKATTAKAMIIGQNPFNPNKLNFITNDLGVSNEEIIAIYGRNPLQIPLDQIVGQPNALGHLIEWYALFRTGDELYNYLRNARRRGLIDNNNAGTAFGWLKVESRGLPSFYLKRFVDDLKIPLEEVIQVCGNNPFEPPIGQFRDGNNGIGQLIVWYIELRTGQPKKVYLKNSEKKGLVKNLNTALGWISGEHDFPLFYLKALTDDMEINIEHLCSVYGRDPFRPPLEEFKKSDNAAGRLIDWYIDFRKGQSREEYLKEAVSLGTIDKFYVADGGISGRQRLWIYYLKRLADDLQIPTEELSDIYGCNPFEPPIETIRNSAKPIGGLIDWYIDFRKGHSRSRYLTDMEKRRLIGNSGTAESWFNVPYEFPIDALKIIIDDLQIPYSQVNQFIDYDIAKANEVATLRASSATPQSIVAAVSLMQIPTDAQSLSQLVGMFEENPTAGVIGLVDVLYAVMPHQIAALERKKIGKQEVVEYLRQHLTSDTGTAAGSGNGNLPPFLTITRIIPFETYQREATVRSHLVNMALKRYMPMPYETAIGQINSQLASNPNEKVLQNVLLETKEYLEGINGMPRSITRVGV